MMEKQASDSTAYRTLDPKERSIFRLLAASILISILIVRTLLPIRSLENTWASMGSVGQDERPSVTILQGTFRGKVLESTNHPVDIEAWLGIRYAQPPLGELRFARPVPLPPSTETFDAVEFGFKCPAKQLIKMPGMPESSEDCLTLNVFRQKGSAGKGEAKLPIMIYFHGGAFNRGTAAMHDTASMLAHSVKPFLAISFNYRVGALGFLNCDLTANEGLLNVGLHDQRLVLEWVQQNAAAFGGDPSNVTAVGLSAGAHSIAHHMMNINEPRKLFHKAIIESGGHTSRVVHPYSSKLHAKQFTEFLAAAGVPKDLPESEILAYLRQLPEDVIVKAEIKVFDQYNPSIRWAWQPVIDNEVISRRPLDAWRSGNWHKIPVMTGFNHNEGSMYVPKNLSASSDFRKLFSTLLPQLDSADLDRLEQLYPDPNQDTASPYLETRSPKYKLGSQFKRLEAAYGHYAYVAPVRQTAHLATTIDREHSPIYLYHWAANSSILNGANHGDQMWYETMDPKVRAVSERHEMIARWFHGYVCNFITEGSPNAKAAEDGRPIWKEYKDGGGTMVFGEGNDERAGGEGKGVEAEFKVYGWAEEETKFWWEVGEKYED